MVRISLGLSFGASLMAAFVGPACNSSDDAKSDDSAGIPPGGGGVGGAGGQPGAATSVTTGVATTGRATTSVTTMGATTTDGQTSEPAVLPKFDLGGLPDVPDTELCFAPSPVVCDEMDDDLWHAMGLNCPGGPQVAGTYDGHPEALHVHTGDLGTFAPSPWAPREGQKYLVLSSGRAENLAIAGSSNENVLSSLYHLTLPEPMRTTNVSPNLTCADDPALVGTGDCSNTIEQQWTQGGDAFDLAVLSLATEVPEGTYGLSFDFAFFSREYPQYYQSEYNDMFVAWLESEQWTGNVSFDEAGNPISLNAGFLDFRDAPNATGDCPLPCEAPELTGTNMDGHAATKWLTTTAPVVPGEQIELHFAIFDLSDGTLDSTIILDNFLWTCEGGPPVTIPG